ncbi:MAG TPA: DUF5302 domain-containing protein [Streptosporangiaceae bacterium]|nr:DUF5302 domain-containing protein [Streptosporangiaceae bacterium]
MATQQSGAEASEASEGSAPESAAPQAADAAAGEASAKPDLDETKRKFREALERKRGNHASAQGADHTGKVHGSHGPATSRRSFRRKSG